MNKKKIQGKEKISNNEACVGCPVGTHFKADQPCKPMNQKKISYSILVNFFATSQENGKFVLHSETDRERYEKLEQFVFDLLAEQKAEWVKKIEGAKFPYEHYWYEAKQDQRLCETCFEVVERYTPCKASKHYPCWQVMNDLLQLIQKGGEL